MFSLFSQGATWYSTVAPLVFSYIPVPPTRTSRMSRMPHADGAARGASGARGRSISPPPTTTTARASAPPRLRDTARENRRGRALLWHAFSESPREASTLSSPKAGRHRVARRGGVAWSDRAPRKPKQGLQGSMQFVGGMQPAKGRDGHLTCLRPRGTQRSQQWRPPGQNL